MKYIIFIISVCIFMSCESQSLKDNRDRMNTADKRSSEKTKDLYSLLFQNLSRGVMIGHQDDLSYGNQWHGEKDKSDMKSVCGDYPAVFGWDLGKIESDALFNSDSVSFESIKEQIKRAYKMHGISTISWQADNPLTGGDALDCSGEAVVESILPGNANHANYLKYLDQLAVFFLDLKDDDGNLIPIIFRPFHSSNEKKYWWNTTQCSPEAFKQLWQFTFDYLSNNKKVNNLLYAYSVANVESLEELSKSYPGNDYTDIIGAEVYFDLENDPEGALYKNDLDRNLSIINSFSDKHKKIPALTETGLEGVKLFNFFSSYVYPIIAKYPISYSLFWKNDWNDETYYHIPIPGHPACDDFINFVNKKNIITIKSMFG